MRQLYLEYKDHPNLQQLVGEIPWGQNLVILSKIKSFAAREYYLRGVREQGWTRNILLMQINSDAYARHAFGKKQHTFQQALLQHFAEQADYTMKDIYMLTYLALQHLFSKVKLKITWSIK